MKYNSYMLQDVCEFIDYRGKTPVKTKSGIPLVTAKIIKNGAILAPKEFIAEESYMEWMRRGIPRKGDIVFTTEAPLGEVAEIKTDERLAFAQRIIVMEPDREYLHNHYLLYALQDKRLKNRIVAKSLGTTVMGIRAADLKKIVIDLPSIEIQTKIADILYSLDEKISLNAAVNDNMADLLQTIYQQQFGGGSSSTSVRGTLANICAYSKERMAVTALDAEHYYSTENMLPGKAGSTEASSFPTTSQITACRAGDTLVSNIRPYFKKIVYCQEACGCSMDVLCFSPIKPQYASYLFSTLYADKFFDFMVAGSKGTKMPRGDKRQIMTYPVIIPSDTELDDFNAVAVPILAQIQRNRIEIRRLTLLRDSLLPKLMSGEIDVSQCQ